MEEQEFSREKLESLTDSDLDNISETVSRGIINSKLQKAWVEDFNINEKNNKILVEFILPSGFLANFSR